MNKLKATALATVSFVCTVLLIIVSNKLERIIPELRPYIACFLGIVLGVFYFRILRLLLRRIDSLPEFLTNAHHIWTGLGMGVTVAVASTLILYADGHTTDFSSLLSFDAWHQLLFQFRPAIIEEVGFRYGIVTAVLCNFGKHPALLLGSIPFGLLHLLNFASGNEIYWEYILGTSVAGFFLTSVFLKFGLFAAIGAHYGWNVFASVLSASSSFKQEQLEAGFGTYLILVLVSFWLLVRSRHCKTA